MRNEDNKPLTPESLVIIIIVFLLICAMSSGGEEITKYQPY
jgi:hypothetical protein